MKIKSLFLAVMLVYIGSYCYAPIHAICASGSMPFAESTHLRTDEYPAQFNTFRAQDEFLDLSIQKSIYESKSAAAIWQQATRDILQISHSLKVDQKKPVLYIVPQTLNGSVQVTGNRIYCTQPDIMNGNYREALVCAALGIKEPWMAKGVNSYVYNAEFDQGALFSYYSNAQSLDVLSMFAAYFNEAFTDDDQLAIANATAVSYCRYTIKQHGVYELLQKGQVYVQEWLTSLGIKRTYDNPYLGCFDGFRYTGTRDYPLVIISNRSDMFYFRPIKGKIETPEQIQEILFEATQGAQAILTYIGDHAPEFSAAIYEHYSSPIYYYCQSEYGISLASGDRRIYLDDSSSLLHETVHMMVPGPYDARSIWQYEAMAEYLPAIAYPPKGEKVRYFRVLTTTFSGKSADDQIGSLIQQIYKNNAKIPTAWHDVDVLLFKKSMAAATMLQPDLKSSSDWVSASIAEVRSGRISAEYDGNELTYPQALSFGDYLITQYGLSSMIHLCLDTQAKFIDIYGSDYDAMKLLWTNDTISRASDGLL